MDAPKFKRVLIKLSGEALQGKQKFGLEPETLERVADEVCEVHSMGVQIGLVVGGGNFFRGVPASRQGMERVSADYIGMLVTIINAVALQDSMEKRGTATRVQSSIEVPQICEPYIRRRAIRHMEKDRVVIFAAGTGNPYFTTDTAASLRAIEIGAEVILKATDVEGVYDSDPKVNKDAVLFKELTHLKALRDKLKVMDATAISLCMENNLPIIVFNLNTPGNIKKVITGAPIGTKVN